MAFLDTLGEAVGDPLQIIGVQFASVIPKIFYTAVVVLFGYLLGWFLGIIVKHALKRMKFDEKFRKLHLAKPLENIKVSSLLGWVVKWYTFVVFAAAGAGYIQLYPVTELFTRFAAWFPSLMLAMAIGILGAILAEYVYKMVMHVSTKEVRVMASIAKYFILVVVLLLALDQIIDISVLERVMLILVAGVAVGLSLAIGISFGLALKDEARGFLDSVKK